MMKVTNHFNLPGPLINAIKGFDKAYKDSRGDTQISVTELISPPLIRRLKKEHWDEIEEDASERVWSILGSAVHSILEHAGSENDLTEERLFLEVDKVKVSGQADLYEANGTLSDYKITSVWSVLNGVKPEWEQQLNILALLYETAGFKVEKLQIVTILRDWSKGRSHTGNYPDCNVKVIPIVKWTKEKTLEFIKERIAIHKAEPVECTAKEKWHKPTKYAAMKKGRKSALKLCETFEDAQEYKGCDYVERRPGKNTRCDDYCSVNKFCPYYEGDEVNDR